MITGFQAIASTAVFALAQAGLVILSGYGMNDGIALSIGFGSAALFFWLCGKLEWLA